MKTWLPVTIAVVIILIAGATVLFLRHKTTSPASTFSTSSDSSQPAVAQLPAADQPKVSIRFDQDGHYVTVSITNLHAQKLEYNLIYDATIKGNLIQTGVNASTDIVGQTVYEKRQLLGSESSGHFTYHENIKNATLELTLRDDQSRSVFVATYPFTVKAGASFDLKPQE